MYNYFKKYSGVRLLLSAALYVATVLPSTSNAVPLNLATVPLVSSTTTQVLPNILFVLDNSGSMDLNYLPDWASSGTATFFKNSGYNGIYYNPAINYLPALNYDGSSKGSQTSWTNVKNDAFGIQDTNSSDLVGTAAFYTYVAGEYCTKPDLKDCVAATAASPTYPYAANLRWCSSSAIANMAPPTTTTTNTTGCQALRISPFTNARYPRQATSRITIGTSAIPTTVATVTVNGKQILSVPTTLSTDNNAVASEMVRSINACFVNTTGLCTVAGFSASSVGNIVTINGPGDLGNLIASNFTPAVTAVGGMTFTRTAFSGYVSPGLNFLTNIVTDNDAYTFAKTGAKAITRTDCAGSSCTYAEEMTNYANWWTYYHTRMQSMKTAASLAFNPIDNKYRVGFMQISGQTANYLAIDTFNSGSGNQKDRWFTKLFSTDPTTSTPLRSALSIAGRIYAGKKPFTGSGDPVQYSCQQNFTVLTTDGYWNQDTPGTVKDVLGNQIGNLDGGATPRPMNEGPTASTGSGVDVNTGSLADVAKYYYDTDLRTAAFNNCNGALGVEVCTNNVFVSGTDNNIQQHMTTFTMGLGIEGTLLYSDDYKTAVSGDFADVKSGAKNWSVPAANNETSVDDLWHAAVNGQGTYFSAKTPLQMANGLKSALSSIKSKVGAGGSAATSTVTPVAGDNFAYVPSYTSVKWTGNLEARTVSTTTGAISDDAVWCAEDVAAGTCKAPSSIVAETVSGSQIYNCVTPSSTPALCSTDGGILVGTNCKVQVATSCTGTMAAKVGTVTDTRVIKMNYNGALGDFTQGNLTPTQQYYFSNAFLVNNLSQWNDLTTAQQNNVAGNFINFLRGQKGFEDRTSNIVDNRVYRQRETVLGDIIESQPVYVANPIFSYTDFGYQNYKASVSRPGTVYVGANDGMLHAFDANTGNEIWAYVPTEVIPNMWKLADKNYSTIHSNFVNGDPVVSDICVSSCNTIAASWRTILVAGLNGGGRGYYALDVTNPNLPVLLWEFGPTQDNNIGYTYGTPVITKNSAGRWVVVFTSGYNNTSGSNAGKGFLYVVDAYGGSSTYLKTMPTGAGTAADPSGLAQISAFVDQPSANNLATYIYGGDLLGNVWRFDINTLSSSSNPLKFATLHIGATVQPITTKPELVSIDFKRVIYVGTGKYLEITDLTNTQQQSLYAIKDDNATATLTDPRATLVQQTITDAGGIRTGSSLPVNFNTGRGWYLDFPDSGERQNVDSLLLYGVLIVPTTVPSNTVCNPGGYGWVNFIDYKTGGQIAGSANAGEKVSSPTVGISQQNLTDVSGNITPGINVGQADGSNENKTPPTYGGGSGTNKQRAIRREFIPPQ